jgi:hypothetical protein
LLLVAEKRKEEVKMSQCKYDEVKMTRSKDDIKISCFMKIKKLLHNKRNGHQIKEAAYKWEKILASVYLTRV